MGAWDLDGVDVLLRGAFVQRDDRDGATFLRDGPYAVLGLLARLGRAKRKLDSGITIHSYPRAVLHCAKPPPPFVVDVARELGASVDRDGLAKLEANAPRLDRAAGAEPYWRACFRLAAFTGEVVRRRIGGRWTTEPTVGTLLALRYAAHADANIVDKAMKLLRAGAEEESLVHFVSVVESLAREA